MATDDEVLVAVDIGTTEVRAVVASRTATGSVGCRGVKRVAHHGLKAGRPVDVGATTHAVSQAVGEVLAHSRTKPDGLVLGVSGDTFRLHPRRGSLRLGSRGGVVRPGDVRTLYRHTLSRCPLHDFQRVGAIERRICLDDERIPDPVGRAGRLLEIALLELFVEEPTYQLCQQLSQSLALPLACILVHPLSTGSLLLPPEVKEQGGVMVDFGAAHTHLSFFCESHPLDAAAFSFGSMHLSAELARRLRIRFSEAERLKLDEGRLYPSEEEGEWTIELDDETTLRRAEFAHLLRQILSQCWLPSLREALQWRGGADAFPGGVVLSGQGSQLPELGDWVAKALKLPVRMGRVSGPRFGSEWQHPALHTVLGLATYALEKRTAPPVGEPGWWGRLMGWRRRRQSWRNDSSAS